jgi:hypothetical protein
MFEDLFDLDGEQFFPSVVRLAEAELQRCGLDIEAKPTLHSRVAHYLSKIREGALKENRGQVVHYVNSLLARQENNRIAQRNRRGRDISPPPGDQGRRGRPRLEAFPDMRRAAVEAPAPAPQPAFSEVYQDLCRAASAVEAVNVLHSDPTLKPILTREDLDILTRHNMTGLVLVQIQEDGKMPLFDVLHRDIKISFDAAFGLAKAVLAVVNNKH